ncbi:MAG TPA: redoxin domain-containing protein [Opitutaceae bacterium]|nr:redoxin domain-containing protein [Opitutaceae bacterium]
MKPADCRFVPLSILSALAALAPLASRAAGTVGLPAPDFSLTDLNGHVQRLADYRGRIVVLEWTNPECPIVRKHYRSGNMPALQRSAASGGAVWLSINSGYPGSQGDYDPARVAAWLKSTGASPTAYMKDPDGRVGRLYGAKATPDMFVIAADGTLVYAGAIDSIASSDQSDIARATNYVRAALDALWHGRPVAVSTSRPYGCSIKY